MSSKQKSLTVGQKIGQYVKYQREKNNLSLTEVAQSADLDPSFLLRLEKGEYNDIKFLAIVKLAKSFQMTTNDFLLKCRLIEKINQPQQLSLEYFLKEKYQLPAAAISLVQVFVEFIQAKYRQEIVSLKLKRAAYWKKQSQKK